MIETSFPSVLPMHFQSSLPVQWGIDTFSKEKVLGLVPMLPPTKKREKSVQSTPERFLKWKPCTWWTRSWGPGSFFASPAFISFHLLLRRSTPL